MGTRERRQERVLEGLPVAPGIAIGVVEPRRTGAVEIPTYEVVMRDVPAEQARLDAAIEEAQRQIQALGAKADEIDGAAGEELGMLLDAHAHMLDRSRLVRGARRRISDNHVNAEAAVEAEIADIARVFQAMEDTYLAARMEDIREVGNRLLRNLMRKPLKPFSAVPEGSIVLADQITPADAAQMDPKRIAGCAAMLGGAEGHTAIMARALGLPMVLGVAGLLDEARRGRRVIVDGDSGRVILNPTPTTLAAYERKREERARHERRLQRLRDLPAVTRDGLDVTLMANIELPIEMEMVRQVGAAGIGLLRTEFLFMNRDDLPSEDEQAKALSRIVAAMAGRPVTVRTLDVGGEKAAPAVLDGVAPGAVTTLGLRGIRLSLKRPDALETQFRAILRASREGPVRILLPMVSTASEVKRARELLARAAGSLGRRRPGGSAALPPVGAMIEVPGAALAADALAHACDFFAIGSNDLTMYTLAIDRANETVAGLFDPMHPAVLRLMQFSAEAGLRAGIPVSICGEVAGDPRYAALLLGLGFRELSMAPANIPRVKSRIREMDSIGAGRRARLIMDQVDSGRIATLLDDFNALAS